MALVAGYPVLTEPPGPDLSLADSRILSFRSLDGDLFPLPGPGFFGMNGMTGLDYPDINVVRDGTPGMVGERIRNISYDTREIFIPMFTLGRDHAELLALRDQIEDLVDFEDVDYQTLDGTFDLVANSIRGERYVRCLCTKWSTKLAKDSGGAIWEVSGLTLLAVQPLWVGESWETRPIRKAPTSSFFGKFPPTLSSSQVLGGQTTVTVPGRSGSWATADLLGPCDSVTITADGLSLSIPDGLEAGEQAKIVTNPRGRTALFGFDGSLTKDWSRIAPSDLYQPISPGIQPVTFDLENPTLATQAVLSGDSYWKRPW